MEVRTILSSLGKIVQKHDNFLSVDEWFSVSESIQSSSFGNQNFF